ncbi:phosphatidylserine decarboxylase [Rubellicoccus peritrichatus]|uniref:Phosphatidylserine decarboxylase n=1 Tax=Rubellicoccus peritrichatus TaxID=3080537 RepID=A0AAQ3LDA7_9BACT|nr:phosphatidylserine decarboxylase [Puniceicoccus sp. CR14]WOO42412.1 phosphatidylserine decarboxylase [Puniceicoccus sp. CR14]
MGNNDEDNAIHFRNRYTGKTETEQVYGGHWLGWAYNNPLGRLTVSLAVARPWFSKWYGWRMRQPASQKKIFPFIEEYGLDAAEFLRPPDHFESFDQFFYRQLKPAARPIDSSPDSVVFPADGRHLGFQDTSRITQVFVKGQTFDLPKLLGDTNLAERFIGGSLVLSRLCPVDYHRFHFPAEGIPGAPNLVSGPLYSVNPVALRRRLAIFWENKREVTLLKTERFGDIAIIEVGATCVGSIVQTHVPGQHTEKGGEKGYFRFGGSSVITLFQKGKICLDDDLIKSTSEGLELYARMGDQMGVFAD